MKLLLHTVVGLLSSYIGGSLTTTATPLKQSIQSSIFLYAISSPFITIVVDAQQRIKGDLYKILGVAKDARTNTIKKAYRALSKKYHPDVNSSKDAADKFKNIARAYEILSDEKKRNAYDRSGMDGVERVESGQDVYDGGDVDSIFSSLFFGRQSSHTRGREKNDDTELKLFVTLSQLYHGELFHISYKRSVLCIHSDECVKHRPDCSAPGISLVTQQLAANYIVQSQKSDPTCVGRNKGWNKNCSKCKNGPLEVEESFLTGIIEPGMKDGNVITFDGAGEQSLNLDAGDLKLIITEENEHDKYIRDDNDNLHTQIFITLPESLLGFNMTIPHISGNDVVVTKSGITMEGEVLILKNQGMRKLDSSDGSSPSPSFGDLYIKVRIRHPASELDQESKDHIHDIFSRIQSWTHLTVPNSIYT